MNLLEALSIGRPITRGPLSLYPLYCPSNTPADYVTGPLAASRDMLLVGEADGGIVPTLSVTNRRDEPLLLIEGETFEGGRQNRVLNVSVLLPHGVSNVPVSCVEAHRWSDDGEMHLSDHRAPRRLRRAKNRSVQHSMRAEGTRHSDQGAVWSAVEATLTARHVPSDTANLHSAFRALDALRYSTDTQHSDERAAIAVSELAELGPLPTQTGVVVAAGGRCLAADLFDRPDTLTTYWREIVMSHAFDLPSQAADAPSLDRALRFVRRVMHAEHIAIPGVGIGTEHHWASDRIVANGIEWDRSLVHLSVVVA